MSTRYLVTFCNALSLVFAIIITLAGCQKAKPTATGDTSDAFSNRPIQQEAQLFVVTLKSDPLLTNSHRTHSGWQISEARKQEIINEQTRFEEELAQLSPESQIVFRYRLILNGVAIFGPANVVERLITSGSVRSVTAASPFARPDSQKVLKSFKLSSNDVTSVSFIGAHEAHKRGATGLSMRIGILDTGIDYTHKMLGGPGREEDYKSIDPKETSSLFPNNKVVGGVDLAGTGYHAGGTLPEQRKPNPDNNPLDEAGHGTHVAGTVAGIGDGKRSYSGVAPDASLYAIKVFGKAGFTSDAVVIAGLEYSVDPNGDLDPSDQLDVVNLSLGGAFGQPNILYSEAVRNLSQAGTIVVASAGNSGPIDYVVGAPGTAADAISVAASIDGSSHTWRFPAVRFSSSDQTIWLAKAVEGPISKQLEDISSAGGQLVYLALADQDFSDEVKEKLKGNIAFIDRGAVPFADKIRRAQEGGAVGVVMANNTTGAPVEMGGDGKFDIPAVMISLEDAQKVKLAMINNVVTVDLKTTEKVEEPTLIDTVTDFSSKGPRSDDSLLKPEISAPGKAIISASVGTGSDVVMDNGTSMAAPHIAGVMALLKQTYPDLSGAELKALLMQTAKPLNETPISLQGAGRVQVDQAINTPILVNPGALSLGRMQFSHGFSTSRKITIRNLRNEPLRLQLNSISGPGLKLVVPPQLALAPLEQKSVSVGVMFQAMNEQALVTEWNGRIEFKTPDGVIAQLPALAIRTLNSRVVAKEDGGQLVLNNGSVVPGIALAFNLIGQDARKVADPHAPWKDRGCDMQSVGYRIIKKPAQGGTADFIQFAFKLHTPLTTWFRCEVSVLIDGNADGVADQELAGVSAAGVEGIALAQFQTLLLNAHKAKEIRASYEEALKQGGEDAPKLDYTPALVAAGPMAPFQHSSLAVIEAPLNALMKTSSGELRILPATLTQNEDDVEADDYLGAGSDQWISIPAQMEQTPYFGMDEIYPIQQGAHQQTQIQKGSTQGKLILYYPINQMDRYVDDQFQIVEF